MKPTPISMEDEVPPRQSCADCFRKLICLRPRQAVESVAHFHEPNGVRTVDLKRGLHCFGNVAEPQLANL